MVKPGELPAKGDYRSLVRGWQKEGLKGDVTPEKIARVRDLEFRRIQSIEEVLENVTDPQKAFELKSKLTILREELDRFERDHHLKQKPVEFPY